MNQSNQTSGDYLRSDNSLAIIKRSERTVVGDVLLPAAWQLQQGCGLGGAIARRALVRDAAG